MKNTEERYKICPDYGAYIPKDAHSNNCILQPALAQCVINLFQPPLLPSRLGIQLFRALTRKRSITCASVTLTNVTLLCRPLKSAGRSPPRTTIVRDDGDAVRTQRSGGQPEYEPIRAACNRLAQLSTCTYLLQRRCDSGVRRVRST